MSILIRHGPLYDKRRPAVAHKLKTYFGSGPLTPSLPRYTVRSCGWTVRLDQVSLDACGASSRAPAYHLFKYIAAVYH